MNEAKILLADDDEELCQLLRDFLGREGFAVDVTFDGDSAYRQAIEGDYDALVLDVMLPGINGFEVTTELRRLGLYVPVLILTARGGSEDVLSGFGSGADDYLTKPFELPIFLSRVRGLLRRHEWFRLDAARKSAAAEYAFAGRVIDFELLELRVGDKRMPLTMMEAALLRYFVENEGKPVARKTILDRVWNVHEDTDTRAIDNFVVRLRRYIENEPTRPRHLQTIRGVGYKFVADPG